MTSSQKSASGTEITGWAGTCFQICGATLVAINTPYTRLAYVIMLVGALLSLCYCWRAKEYPMLFLNLSFVLLNIVGIIRWA